MHSKNIFFLKNQQQQKFKPKKKYSWSCNLSYTLFNKKSKGLGVPQEGVKQPHKQKTDKERNLYILVKYNIYQ